MTQPPKIPDPHARNQHKWGIVVPMICFLPMLGVAWSFRSHKQGMEEMVIFFHAAWVFSLTFVIVLLLNVALLKFRPTAMPLTLLQGMIFPTIGMGILAIMMANAKSIF